MTARIADRGYRRYDGPRLGPAHAVRSLIAHTLRRILGLQRPARSKILPVMTIVFSYLPATVFVGIVALFGNRISREVTPRYSGYYGFIISAILLFVAFVAPEALCPDRRSRALSLYLASPLTRGTYLLAKVAAVMAVLALVTLGPPLLLLIGLALQSAGPDGFGGFLLVLVRVAVSGTMLAALYTSISLAASSVTDRRAVAAAGTLFVVLGSGVVSNTLLFALNSSRSFVLLSLTRAPAELVVRIYGEPGFIPQVGTLQLALAVAAWTVAGAAVTWWRYRSLQVTR